MPQEDICVPGRFHAAFPMSLSAGYSFERLICCFQKSGPRRSVYLCANACKHQHFLLVFLKPTSLNACPKHKIMLAFASESGGVPSARLVMSRRMFSVLRCPQEEWLVPGVHRNTSFLPSSCSSRERLFFGVHAGLSLPHPVWFHKCLLSHEVWVVLALCVCQVGRKPSTGALFSLAWK